MLSRPNQGENLYLYLFATNDIVASVLVREEKNEQVPIYYVSKVLRGVEQRYPVIEKIAYAVVISAARLRPYFQAHIIIVRIDIPLHKLLQKVETSRRLIEWAIRLGEFDIRYEPKKALKAQVLADFVVEMSDLQKEVIEQQAENKRE